MFTEPASPSPRSGTGCVSALADGDLPCTVFAWQSQGYYSLSLRYFKEETSLVLQTNQKLVYLDILTFLPLSFKNVYDKISSVLKEINSVLTHV